MSSFFYQLHFMYLDKNFSVFFHFFYDSIFLQKTFDFFKAI